MRIGANSIYVSLHHISSLADSFPALSEASYAVADPGKKLGQLHQFEGIDTEFHLKLLKILNRCDDWRLNTDRNGTRLISNHKNHILCQTPTFTKLTGAPNARCRSGQNPRSLVCDESIKSPLMSVPKSVRNLQTGRASFREIANAPKCDKNIFSIRGIRLKNTPRIRFGSVIRGVFL